MPLVAQGKVGGGEARCLAYALRRGRVLARWRGVGGSVFAGIGDNVGALAAVHWCWAALGCCWKKNSRAFCSIGGDALAGR